MAVNAKQAAVITPKVPHDAISRKEPIRPSTHSVPKKSSFILKSPLYTFDYKRFTN